MSKRPEPPETLPADFFTRKKTEPPDTLPADFFNRKPLAPQGFADRDMNNSQPAVSGPAPKGAPGSSVGRYGAGVLSGVKALANIPSAVYHAATDPLTEAEQKQGLPFPSLQRLFIEPQYAQFEKAMNAETRPDPQSGVPIAKDPSYVAQHLAASFVPVLGPGLSEIADKHRSGDTAGALGELTAFGLAPKVVAKGKPLLKKPVTAVVGKTRAIVTGVHPDPVVSMTQALKPYAKNTDWNKAITSSLPEIKASEGAMGRAIANVDDMLEATKIAKKRLRADFDAIKGPKAAQMVDGSPIANAIEGTISKKLQLENPGQAASIKELADKYRKSFTVEELDDFLHTYNAELDSYYSKYPAAKRTALAGNPDTASLEAGARATRDTLYRALDDPRVGRSAREINQRYGKLINVEKELYRRKNVNDRQAPESLTEQMGKMGAAFQGAKGAIKMVTMTDPMGGLADIGSAVAGRKMAQILKERNSTDFMIRKTFERFQQPPINVTPRKR